MCPFCNLRLLLYGYFRRFPHALFVCSFPPTNVPGAKRADHEIHPPPPPAAHARRCICCSVSTNHKQTLSVRICERVLLFLLFYHSAKGKRKLSLIVARLLTKTDLYIFTVSHSLAALGSRASDKFCLRFSVLFQNLPSVCGAVSSLFLKKEKERCIHPAAPPITRVRSMTFNLRDTRHG